MLLVSTAAPSAAEDNEQLLSGSFGIGSDYTFRGISQTLGGNAIEVSVDLSLRSGIYAYAWGSNVDFVPDGEPDDGASHEIDLAIGYATDISENWSVDVALIRYLFPGTAVDIDYDYNELMASLYYADNYSATVAYSGNVDGTGEKSLLYRLGASFGFPFDTSFDICYGYHDLSDAYGSAYSYVESALARQFGNATISLAYNNTDRSSDLIYDSRMTGPRFVLSLQVEW